MSPQDPAMMQQMMQGGGAPAPEQEPSLCANCAYFRPVEEDGSIGVCQRLSDAQAGDPAWLESEGGKEPPVFICTPEFACILWEPGEDTTGAAAALPASPEAPEDAMLQQLLVA